MRDADEIADLKDRQKTLSTMARAVTPILIPLTDGTELADLVDLNAAVTFDLDGGGLVQKWQWITPKAAWLVFDADGRGQITSGLQMFGNVTFWIFWRNGYEALRSLDDDNDNVIRGSEMRGLALWHDSNGNGASDPGEVRTASEWNISALSCEHEIHLSGVSWSPQGVTFSDGRTRPTYDWIAEHQGRGRVKETAD